MSNSCSLEFHRNAVQKTDYTDELAETVAGEAGGLAPRPK